MKKITKAVFPVAAFGSRFLPATKANPKEMLPVVQARSDGYQQLTNIVEKPHPDVAPSNLAVVGRYILTPRVFDKLRKVQPGSGGEIQLTDGIATLLQEETVLALPLAGTRYDCGSKLGYLKATVRPGAKHAEIGAVFSDYLQQMRTAP
jgi:UTP--glucose-1-phosphate uridylyltransferase